jgi:hypothetical protein
MINHFNDIVNPNFPRWALRAIQATSSQRHGKSLGMRQQNNIPASESSKIWRIDPWSAGGRPE